MVLRLEMTERTQTSITLRISGAGNAVTSAFYDIRNIVRQTGVVVSRQVNGSVNYYINGDGYYSVTTTFSGLSPGTSYSFKYELRPIGSFTREQSHYFSTEAEVLPDPDPGITNLSVLSNGTISASWNVANSAYMRSANSMAVYLSGANNSVQYFRGYLQSWERSWSNGLAGDGAALIPGANYTIWIYVYNSSGQSFEASRTVTFTRPRPTNFNWTYAKSSGGEHNLTVAEWESFLDKINEFRAYRGLVQRSLRGSILVSGAINGVIEPTAANFNAARNAINDMSTVSFSVSSRQVIDASHLNTLRNILNSIT